MQGKGTTSLEVKSSQEQRPDPRLREFLEFGTASLRGITVVLAYLDPSKNLLFTVTSGSPEG